MIRHLTILALLALSAGGALAADGEEKPVNVVTFPDLVGTWTAKGESQPVMIGKTTDSSGKVRHVPVFSAHRYIASDLFLLIRADGGYEYRADITTPGCAFQASHAGAASVENGELLLQPSRNHWRSNPAVDNPACRTPDHDVPLQPLRYEIQLDKCLLLMGERGDIQQFCHRAPETPPAAPK